MTEENKRANATDELAQAAVELKAAEALLQLGLWGVSVTRSYYAVFHLAQALLFSRGLQARKHAGVFHLLRTEFVELVPVWNDRWKDLKEGREAADYKADVTISETEARTAFGHAQEFDALVRARLAP